MAYLTPEELCSTELDAGYGVGQMLSCAAYWMGLRPLSSHRRGIQCWAGCCEPASMSSS
ncbi:hypothetical protein AVEN_247035-1, partial [Araneus ventricosus]